MKAHLLLVAFLLHAYSVHAERKPNTAETYPDHLFAPKGSSMVTLVSGLPYIGVIEYAYGLTDRFSVGLMAGFTPKVPGYGFRLRGVLYENDEQDFRMTLRAPTFYYPQTRDLGGEPWWLTFPTLAAEWKTTGGMRFSAEGGVIATVCAESLGRTLFGGKSSGEMMHGESHDDSHTSTAGHDMQEMGFEGGVLFALGGGVSIPLSSSLSFQSNLDLVFDGFKIAGKSTAVETPFIFVVGLSYVL